MKHLIVRVGILISAAGLVASSAHAQARPTTPQERRNDEVQEAVHHDISAPLRDIPAIHRKPGEPPGEHPLRLIHPGKVSPPSVDPVAQQTVGIAVGATPGIGFDGIGIPIRCQVFNSQQAPRMRLIRPMDLT